MLSRLYRIHFSNLLYFLVSLVAEYGTNIVDFLATVIQRSPVSKHMPGLYEVLDYNAQLVLADTRGRSAIYSRIQRVRFLQNNVIAYQDTAWGDGDIFAEYRCSPGIEVDRYREGHRHNILISLRETKHRGDEDIIRIHRKINNGFMQNVEEFQTDIHHRTRRLALSIIFPKRRLPTRLTVVEQNISRSTPLDERHRDILPDGRHQYSWETQKPKLFEAYILRWEW